MSIKFKSHILFQLNIKILASQADIYLVNSILKTTKRIKLQQRKANLDPKPHPNFVLRFLHDGYGTQYAPQLPSNSNIRTPLTDRPQFLSFEKAVGKVFDKSLIGALTSKDAVLKEVRDCIIRDDGDRLKTPYLHSYWRDLRVISGCVCMDDKMAIPNAPKEALIEDLQANHPGIWGMICKAQHYWCQYINRNILFRSIE